MSDDDDVIEDDSSDDGTLTRAEVLDHAIRIAKDYASQGLTLTLRQLYYRFVATGLAPSGQKVYKRIGSVLTEARYDGRFPISWLEDRGRSVGEGEFTRTVSSIDDALDAHGGIVEALPEFLLKRDRWHGQETYVSVWVEKQALEGVFGSVCSQLEVGLFACKGYPSVSALYDFAKQANFVINGEHSNPRHRRRAERNMTMGHGFDWSEEHRGTTSKAVVLYFGDHDPDGFEIPRSANRGLETVMGTYDLQFSLEFKRIALNADQVKLYNPPPFEAKMSSARYRSYRAEHHTDEAWELDALEPKVLQQLIRDSVAPYFDNAVHQQNEREVAELRDELRQAVR